MKNVDERNIFFRSCKRIVVKVGSAVLTKQKGLNHVAIHHLSDQIAELLSLGHEVILVSSGAVAAGMKKMNRSERPKNIPEKQATAAIGQSVLMQAWEEGFRKHELQVSQLLLTAEDLRQRERYLNARNTLETLLTWSVVPIINENDTVAVDEIRFGDNDQLASLIGGLVGADCVVILSDIDGLFEQDPREDPNALLIPFLDKLEEKHFQMASAKTSSVGTGGMKSKLLAAKKSMESGIPLVVMSGRERGGLVRLFSGEVLGTLFFPQKTTFQGKKMWLAHLSKPSGSLILDQGAVRALQEQGCSLLPIGICGVQGTFGIGDPVRCVDQKGKEIGIGLSNYHSHEILQIQGLRSSEIEEKIGYKHSDEVIHRNHFALTMNC